MTHSHSGIKLPDLDLAEHIGKNLAKASGADLVKWKNRYALLNVAGKARADFVCSCATLNSGV